MIRIIFEVDSSNKDTTDRIRLVEMKIHVHTFYNQTITHYSNIWTLVGVLDLRSFYSKTQLSRVRQMIYCSTVHNLMFRIISEVDLNNKDTIDVERLYNLRLYKIHVHTDYNQTNTFDWNFWILVEV